MLQQQQQHTELATTKHTQTAATDHDDDVAADVSVVRGINETLKRH